MITGLIIYYIVSTLITLGAKIDTEDYNLKISEIFIVLLFGWIIFPILIGIFFRQLLYLISNYNKRFEEE